MLPSFFVCGCEAVAISRGQNIIGVFGECSKMEVVVLELMVSLRYVFLLHYFPQFVNSILQVVIIYSPFNSNQYAVAYFECWCVYVVAVQPFCSFTQKVWLEVMIPLEKKYLYSILRSSNSAIAGHLRP